MSAPMKRAVTSSSGHLTSETAFGRDGSGSRLSVIGPNLSFNALNCGRWSDWAKFWYRDIEGDRLAEAGHDAQRWRCKCADPPKRILRVLIEQQGRPR